MDKLAACAGTLQVVALVITVATVVPGAGKLDHTLFITAVAAVAVPVVIGQAAVAAAKVAMLLMAALLAAAALAAVAVVVLSAVTVGVAAA
jgi:hypothetical protein